MKLSQEKKNIKMSNFFVFLDRTLEIRCIRIKTKIFTVRIE